MTEPLVLACSSLWVRARLQVGRAYVSFHRSLLDWRWVLGRCLPSGWLESVLHECYPDPCPSASASQGNSDGLILHGSGARRHSWVGPGHEGKLSCVTSAQRGPCLWKLGARLLMVTHCSWGQLSEWCTATFLLWRLTAACLVVCDPLFLESSLISLCTRLP